MTDSSSISYVRSNPHLFLGPNGEPDLHDLCGFLVVDALVLGAEDVAVRRWNDWFIVSSSFDWISAGSRLTTAEAFNRIQVFHQHKRNSTRSNVIVAAFSREVLTEGSDGLTVVKGDSIDVSDCLSHARSITNTARFVAFRGVDAIAGGTGSA